ncbi:MAG: prepilin peptidase [Desulfarculaceae bacterium]|nr:prepilin peptidase [Desulfarculaceae bacterium]
MILTAFFIFGTCIGSFLNVCILRIPAGKSIVRPPSSCPACGDRIPFYCNLPVISYLFLRGRCRNCGTRISIRYPMVEILTGLFSAALYLRFGLTPETALWFVLICSLIVISIIDLDHQIIPDILSLPGIPVFMLFSVLIHRLTFLQSLTGILAGGGVLYLVSLIYYLVKKIEGMGGGDIKLLAMIGAAVGLKGVIFTIFTGSVLGTLAGIILMIYGRFIDTKLKIPFGPFLAAGTVLYIFFGDMIIRWYIYGVGL